MCLDFPARVVRREPDAAVLDHAGRQIRASTLLVPDINEGDWVLVTAGTVVKRLESAEASDLVAAAGVAKGVIR